MVGESTIARLVNDAAKFPDFCPETRILLLLRDPVDRCVSQFRMRQRLQMKKVHKGSVTGSVRKDLRIFEKGKFSRPKMTADDVLEMKQGYFPKWRSVRYRALFELTKLISFFFLRQRLCPVRAAQPQILLLILYTIRVLLLCHGNDRVQSRNGVYEGAYALHLRRLLDGGFPKSQIRIYWSEDFFSHPRAVLEDALGFLGLDAGPASGMDWSEVEKPVNVSLTFFINVFFFLSFLPLPFSLRPFD